MMKKLSTVILALIAIGYLGAYSPFQLSSNVANQFIYRMRGHQTDATHCNVLSQSGTWISSCSSSSNGRPILNIVSGSFAAGSDLQVTCNCTPGPTTVTDNMTCVMGTIAPVASGIISIQLTNGSSLVSGADFSVVCYGTFR